MDNLARADSILSAWDDGHCALCGAAICTWREDFACPHWLFTHGNIGLHPGRLAAVFRIFQPFSVVNYLRLVTAHDATSSHQHHDTWNDDNLRYIRLHWRLRAWQFSFPLPDRDDEQSLYEFALTTFYRNKMVEEGYIGLLNSSAQVVFFPSKHN